MVDYASHEFWLNSTDSRGATVEDHFRQLGKESELVGPPFPDVIAYLWEAFMELHAARPMGGMGPGPLTFEGIEAWARLTHRSLSPWEVKAIKQVDSAWLGSQAKPKDG